MSRTTATPFRNWNFLPAVIFVSLVCSCGSPDPIEVPPLTLGGGGVTLMRDGETPADQYEAAFAWLPKLHIGVRDSLTSTPPNYYAAEANARRIIDKLTLMKSLVQEPTRAALGTFLERYRRILKSVQARTAGTATLADMNRFLREIRIKYPPEVVTYVTGPTEPSPAPQVNPQPHDRLPPPLEGAFTVPDEGPPPPPLPVSAPGTPFWALYKAWLQVHSDLVTAYRNNRECGPPYERMVALLQLMSDALDENSRPTLDLCRKLYATVHGKTEGFTRLPQGLSKENLLSELDTIERVIRLNYDPDAKK